MISAATAPFRASLVDAVIRRLKEAGNHKVLTSCQSAEEPIERPTGSMKAVVVYESLSARVFLSCVGVAGSAPRRPDPDSVRRAPRPCRIRLRGELRSGPWREVTNSRA